MNAQELIEKIDDSTTVDNILVDLVSVAEDEKIATDKINNLEKTIKERDDKIRELKIDNHELMKKYVDNIDLTGKKDETEKEPEVIKSTDEILKGFVERR